MAANMMEMLKQIQQDQRVYMRNINDKLNGMDTKIVDLDKKINQQQVLVTIERLEQLVRKNNMLLFGNDETENNTEDKTTMSYKPELDAEKTNLSEQTENIKNPEASQLQNSINAAVPSMGAAVALIEEIDGNCKGSHSVKVVEDLTSIETRDNDANVTPIEETSSCAVCKHATIEISPICVNADQIIQIDNKLDRIADIYQSDMRKIKELLNDIAAISNDSITETASLVHKLETENTVSLCNEIKHIVVKTQEESQVTVESVKNLATAVKMLTEGETSITSKNTKQISIIEEMRGLIKDYAVRKMPEESVSKVCEQKTVQISPAYFNTYQIGKLNSELKRIAEMYYASNIFPIIEVIPGAGDEHPVMKRLRKGVYLKKINGSKDVSLIKLGTGGFNRSDVIGIVTDYPNLTFYEVMTEWMAKSGRKFTVELDFTKPMIYNKNDNLVPLTI